MACNLASLRLGCEPKVKVATQLLIIVQHKIKIGLLKDMLIGIFKVKDIIEINDDEEDIENKFYVNSDWCIEH